MCVQDSRAQSLLLDELQQQASALTSNTVQMPERVQRVDELLRSMEAGDVKLRVRVLEAERAARRASVMQVRPFELQCMCGRHVYGACATRCDLLCHVCVQMATLNSVGAIGFLNIGTMLALSEYTAPASLALSLGGVFSVLTLLNFRRVERCAVSVCVCVCVCVCAYLCSLHHATALDL